MGIEIDITAKWTTAGLVFLETRDPDIAEIAGYVVDGLEKLEQRATGVRILSDQNALVSVPNHVVRVSMQDNPEIDGLKEKAASVITVQVSNGKFKTKTTKHSEDAILAYLLKSLHGKLSPDFVKWIGAESAMECNEFILASDVLEESGIRKRKAIAANARRRDLLPPIDDTQELLYKRLASNIASLNKEIEAREAKEHYSGHAAREVLVEDIREETAALRLSTWMITLCVAIFALPLGAALVVVNLLRGENLRLSAQSLALTGIFLTLQSTGSTAEAMAVLQTVL